jgi:acetyltransferase-like isoleucine patch superfamily enzyme
MPRCRLRVLGADRVEPEVDQIPANTRPWRLTDLQVDIASAGGDGTGLLRAFLSGAGAALGAWALYRLAREWRPASGGDTPDVEEVVLGDGVVVEPNCVLRDVRVGESTRIMAGSLLEGAVLGRRCRVGPFARLRPGTELADEAAVGNFVEVKKSRIGAGSKVNHLSYVGDAELGDGVNIGAGTITCNYDGANKHRTVIGNQAFIGSNTALVAPVTVGEDATIGAGSIISKDAPAGELTLSRARQTTIEGWKRPERKNRD